MAKTKPTKPKKRTKKAVAARRCERKLQKRVKAGEPAAIARIEKRKEYHKNYQAKKKQEQEVKSRRLGRERTGSEIRVLMRESDKDATDELDSAIGGSEDGEDGREGNPLFCTPAPPMAPAKTTTGAILNTEARKNVRSKAPAQRPGHRVSETEAKEMPLWRQRLQDRRARAADTAEAEEDSQEAGQSALVKGGRGRLVRRSLGGGLAQSPITPPARGEKVHGAGVKEVQEPVVRESVETLQLLRKKIRNAREALLKEEVKVEIKLRQRAAHGQCHH